MHTVIKMPTWEILGGGRLIQVLSMQATVTRSIPMDATDRELGRGDTHLGDLVVVRAAQGDGLRAV